MPTIDYTSQAYRRGGEDFAAGKPVKANPYQAKSTESANWKAGYNHASRDFERNNRKKNWL